MVLLVVPTKFKRLIYPYLRFKHPITLLEALVILTTVFTLLLVI